VTTETDLVSPACEAEEQPHGEPRRGWTLCLSGGGYRAMLFHLGVLWRLNEAGWLGRLDRISSVSGGSITAGALAVRWQELGFDDHRVAAAFDDVVVAPVRQLARKRIDALAVIRGLVAPSSHAAGYVAKAYDRTLFKGATLLGLPETPTFIFNATNLSSGALVRFTKHYVADWRVGRIHRPDITLAVAVASSSAFPPFLSPFRLQLPDAAWITDPGNELTSAAFRRELTLTDGGVYDNLGLEAAWKQSRGVIVSDAGGLMDPESHPPGDWARHTLRVLKVIDHQVRSLRKRQVIQGFISGQRDGMYIGIRSHVADFHLADPMPAQPEVTLRLANIPTRLTRLDDDVQKSLINWGYVICDTGLRKHLNPAAPKGSLPYTDAAL
jgi:NTE family protein